MSKSPAVTKDNTAISFAILSPKRLAALQRTSLLDTPPEESFDRLTRLAAKLTGAAATFISLLDQHRDFYKSSYGFGEPLATVRHLEERTFCHYAMLSEDGLILDDVTLIADLCDVPTVKSLGVRAYAGIPLVMADGSVIGSFCAIDYHPRHWSERDVYILRELAHSAMREIDLRMAIQETASTNSRLLEQINKVVELNQQLEILSATDSLTGLQNRRKFEHSLAQELLIVERRSTPLSLLVIDVDHFKQVNDTHGHAAGDRVLQKVAVLLGSTARNIDVLARIGGEEFAVILPDTGADSALMIAQRMCAAIANADWSAAAISGMALTISLGAATLLPGEAGHSLMVRADQAMYTAKLQGRNRVVQV